MRLIYHLGYPRTGTTLLQKNIFRYHPEINYLGPKSYDSNYKVQIDQKKIDEFEIFFQNNKDLNYNELHKKIDIKKFSDQKVNIFSSEKYLYYKNYEKYDGLIVLKNFLKNQFHLNFGVIYTVRNQYELIESIYHHSYGYLKTFLKSKSIENLVDKIQNLNFSENNNIFHFLRAYDFNYTYEHIKKKFTDADIKILNFKDLNDNPDKYYAELSNFLHVDLNELKKRVPNKRENPSKIEDNKKILQSEFQRVISENRFYKKIKFIIPSYIKDKIRNFSYTKKKINKEDEIKMKKIVEKFYSKSNENFEKKTGIKIFW